MTNIRYLVIDKKGHFSDVSLKIEPDEFIRRDLGESLRLKYQALSLCPQYRNRVWDGKIRLFSYQTGQIYTGLYLIY